MGSNNNRRSFFRKALFGAGLASGLKVNAEPEKVKMLTPDGELVEIDASLLKNAPANKVSNTDILKWTNQIKS